MSMADVFSSTVPCADCNERRQDLEATGHRVLECADDATLPGYCTIRYTRPAAMADGGPVALAATQAQAARSIVNIFETGEVRGDYSAVTLLPGDTGRLTYGRAQTTLGSGNLHLLISRYCAVTGARFGARLRPWLPVLSARSAAADTDQKLHNLLRASADDPVMRDVQDAFFDEVARPPGSASARPSALRWCTTAGCTAPGRRCGTAPARPAPSPASASMNGCSATCATGAIGWARTPMPCCATPSTGWTRSSA
jgi:chitosanase